MENLYQSYKDDCEFFIVYIREAHPSDGRRKDPHAEDLKIRNHANYQERCTVATRLMKDKKLTIPCIVDGMDNAVSAKYAAYPDRVFLIDKNGRLAVAGTRGPRGFEPALDDVTDWLETRFGKRKTPDDANDAENSQRPRRFRPGPDGERPGRGRLNRGARNPLINALDADGDGVISAAEIENAPTALKALDRNKDGKLTRDEIRPSGRPRERLRRPDNREPPPL